MAFDEACKESDSATGANTNSGKRTVTAGKYTGTEQKSGGDFFTQIGLGHSGGCCPGQTGHHLIPGSWAEGGCKGYENKPDGQGHKCAPVVCVEGVGQYDGTHGEVHKSLDDKLKEALNERQDAGNNSKTFTFDEIVTMSAQAHSKHGLFSCRSCNGEHRCSEACIEEQLTNAKAYEKCERFTPEAIRTDGNNSGGGNTTE